MNKNICKWPITAIESKIDAKERHQKEMERELVGLSVEIALWFCTQPSDLFMVTF